MSVKKNPRTGSWDVRWRQDGRQRSKAFRTRKDAELFESDIVRRRQLGTLAQIDAGLLTLDEYVAEVWVPQHADPKLSANSRQTYSVLYRVHIAEPLGGVRLRDITPSLLRSWQDERLRDGAGRSALNQALTLVGSILQRAMEDEEIIRNPARIVRKVSTERAPEIRALSPFVVEQVRAQLTGVDRLLVSVLAYAGLRPSEAWALTWEDIRDRNIRIAKATDGFGDVKGTKTGSNRNVRLLAPLAQDLREWRISTGRPADSTLLFPASDGGVVNKNHQGRWRRTVWGPAWQAAAAQAALAAGVEPGTPAGQAAARLAGVDPASTPRVYDLRHSFASLLLAEGRTAHVVARQLGHSPTLTSEVYGHVIEEFDDDDAVRINAAEKILEARDQVCASDVRYGRDSHASG